MKKIVLVIVLGFSLILLISFTVWSYQKLAFRVINEKEEESSINEEESEQDISSNLNPVVSVEPDSELEQALGNIDNSEELLNYLNEFVLEPLNDWTVQDPNILVKEKKGSPADLMVLSTLILDYHGYETGVIRYNYRENDVVGSQVVTVFRDIEEPMCITVADDKVEMFHYGWSFEELFEAEEERRNIEILEYAVFYPGVLNLNPPYWNER